MTEESVFNLTKVVKNLKAKRILKFEMGVEMYLSDKELFNRNEKIEGILKIETL